MSIDIAALDVLPETDPALGAELAELGLLPCRGITCWSTCVVTCFITEW